MTGREQASPEPAEPDDLPPGVLLQLHRSLQDPGREVLALQLAPW